MLYGVFAHMPIIFSAYVWQLAKNITKFYETHGMIFINYFQFFVVKADLFVCMFSAEVFFCVIQIIRVKKKKNDSEFIAELKPMICVTSKKKNILCVNGQTNFWNEWNDFEKIDEFVCVNDHTHC